MISLYNTLSKQLDELRPIDGTQVTMYSCGPTVYDHAHVGNLSAFIVADTLHRVIRLNGYKLKHVMNFTDVDDKTIRRSREQFPDLDPREALSKLTIKYSDLFLQDMDMIGNSIVDMTFVRATDVDVIDGMQVLITDLYSSGFAYIADDGVYFNIAKYRESGKKYGQLVELTSENTSSERINNDEYDKDDVHDFALWKKQKDGEPYWEFTLDGRDISGRPGWHIECSVMSSDNLGQPFDIHTGGIDLAFPHHENEIAQSTAGKDNPVFSNIFVHNEHILVDGKKMSKSLGNFLTLKDLTDTGIDPLAFRMLVLQSHYRKQTNYSHDNIIAAENRLKAWRSVAALRHQTSSNGRDTEQEDMYNSYTNRLFSLLNADLNTPETLAIIDEVFDKVLQININNLNHAMLVDFISIVDSVLGLRLLLSTPDISSDIQTKIKLRSEARSNRDWVKSDQLRDEILAEGVKLRDSGEATLWEYA